MEKIICHWRFKFDQVSWKLLPRNEGHPERSEKNREELLKDRRWEGTWYTTYRGDQQVRTEAR